MAAAQDQSDDFFAQYGGQSGGWQNQPDANGQTGQPPPIAAATGGNGAYGGDPTDVDGWLTWMAQQPGHDPILDTPQGQAYYKTQILSKPDKLNANNLDYWKKKATLAQFGGAVGAGDGGGSMNLGDFGTGSLGQGWGERFQAPSAEDAANTPGFQFTMEQGIKGLERGAAARGGVLNGGEKQDILKYASGLASQDYQQTYQNKLGEYMNAYNIWRNNGNDIFNRYEKVANDGTGAGGAATS